MSVPQVSDISLLHPSSLVVRIYVHDQPVNDQLFSLIPYRVESSSQWLEFANTRRKEEVWQFKTHF